MAKILKAKISMGNFKISAKNKHNIKFTNNC